MFQRKIDELIRDILSVFGIADNILTAGGRVHDVSLEQVLCRCRQANLKLNKEKCLTG